MKFVLVTLLFFYSLNTVAQYDIKKESFVETYNDGTIKSSITYLEKKTKGIKLHEFYLFKEMSRLDLYYDQSKKLEITKKTKKGTYGKPCNEILFHQIEYYADGTKKYEYKSHCDCHKEKRIYYNVDGKITKVEKSSIKWIKPSRE